MTFFGKRFNLGVNIPFFDVPGGTENVPAVRLYEDTVATALVVGVKAVAAAGTPERLVPTASLVDSVRIQARKNKTTANTGAVYIGNSAVAANNNFVLLAGETLELRAENGKKIDLREIYVDAATTADAVSFIAQA